MKQVYARLTKAISQLEKSGLKFAHHQKYGYLTFSPTNIGTTLRLSVQVKLPKLASAYLNASTSANAAGISFDGHNTKLKQLSDSLSVNIGPPNSDLVCEITNKVVLGKSEFEIVSSSWNDIKRILDEEFSTK